ncbi:hypothetical protein Tc00.1047053503739.15 [Trypanosoma cruzi]|uniref:Uncharacterized protein n=1 Tax=Trypanosoma cruzi (strain CL Brener) TaxID=353153 RepID=Q4CXL0_TRYCC|nr:hypothetical protein Tc00.1047053503739.15 [Trypanosoma cruzi]EAN85012.1 hypothetical protein Tc00.1047053503739.15 [Trypanosoma cruzi]|eukprot:XP_806863.1 hypothetical protein [Trypanosoma cruzi strain CL Brener]
MVDEGEIEGVGSRKQVKNIVSTTLFLTVGDRRRNWLLIYPLKVTPVSAEYAACISVGLFFCSFGLFVSRTFISPCRLTHSFIISLSVFVRAPREGLGDMKYAPLL